MFQKANSDTEHHRGDKTLARTGRRQPANVAVAGLTDAIENAGGLSCPVGLISELLLCGNCQLGKSEEDDAAFKIAKSRGVSDLLALFLYQAQVRKNRGRYKESMSYYEGALALNPNLPQIHRGLGHLVYDSVNKCSEELVLGLLEKHSCSDDSISYFRGLLLGRRGDVEESLVMMRKSVSANSENYYAWNNMAYNHLKLNQYERALPLLRHALRGMLKQNDMQGVLLVRSNQALLQTRLGAYETASRQLSHIMRQGIDEYRAVEWSYVLMSAGEVFLRTRRLRESREMFELARLHAKFYHVPQTEVAALYGLCRVGSSERDDERAMSQLREGLKLAIILGDKHWEEKLMAEQERLKLGRGSARWVSFRRYSRACRRRRGKKELKASDL